MDFTKVAADKIVVARRRIRVICRFWSDVGGRCCRSIDVRRRPSGTAGGGVTYTIKHADAGTDATPPLRHSAL